VNGVLSFEMAGFAGGLVFADRHDLLGMRVVARSAVHVDVPVRAGLPIIVLIQVTGAAGLGGFIHRKRQVGMLAPCAALRCPDFVAGASPSSFA